MRLLTWNSQNKLVLTDDLADNVPPYAILSHTWGNDGDEVTFADLQLRQSQHRPGYDKILFCGEQAREDKIYYFWVDTCCIDKNNHVELSEAITSMFRWYQSSVKCYVYLSDVSVGRNLLVGASGTRETWKSSLRSSRWFTRGWTLQELLAPTNVEFFSSEGVLLGTKATLTQLIHEITTIPLAALEGTPLPQFPISERMRWTEKRQTKKKEDMAYCLLGMFNVYMPLIYGEGDNALRRLQKQINEQFGNSITSINQPDNTKSLGLCMASAPLIEPDEFIGRSVEIDAIHEMLRPNEARGEQRRVVLGGMGGMGKTQLAIAYARRHEGSYRSVFWLNATSEPTLHASFRSIAPTFVTPSELDGLNNDQTLARFHDWLSQPHNTQWLLILDNYDDPDQFNINRFCPNTGNGSVIITTRRPDLVTGQQLSIRPLTAIDDGLDILQTRSGRQGVRNDVDARRLAERLAGLPLALVTAGAYLRKSTITFQQYLDTYEQRWCIDPRRPPRLKEYQDRTLYTTWNLSYTRLEVEDAEAAKMLRLMAYFDNQEMWYNLFQKGLSDQSPPWLSAAMADQIDFDSVMSVLVDYCFVEVQHTTQTYSMHGCVHDWTLGVLNRKTDLELYWHAFDSVAASIDEDHWEAFSQISYARISRHAARLVHNQFQSSKLLEPGLLARPDAVKRVTALLTEQLQLSAAEQLFQRVLAVYEEALGPDNATNLQLMNNLGALYATQDNLDEAEKLYRQSLAGKERVYGPDHTSTLSTVNDLGLLCYHQGKLDEAEVLYQRALVGQEKTLGPDDVSTLDTVKNLSGLLFQQDKLDEAEELCKRALTGFERAIGPDHPPTLDLVNNLAVLYAARGRDDEAEELYLRALSGRERTIGPIHKLTLSTVENLANLYDKIERYDEAEELYQQALAGKKRTYGPEHISTLETAQTLKRLRENQDRSDKESRSLMTRRTRRYST